MLSTRWRKILRDLWGNRTRTTLAVLSIAVGVFSVGMIAGSQEILRRELNASWNAADPASAVLYPDGFDQELLSTVRNMPAVDEAEAHRAFWVRFRVGGEEWRSLRLKAFSDYDDIHVFVVRPISGAWPPPDREVLIEQNSLDWMGVKVGDTITIEAPNGKLRQLRIAGIARDVNGDAAAWVGQAYGFISFDTLEWLGMPRDFSELDIVVAENPEDMEHIRRVVELVRDRVEKSGRTVWGTYVFTPGRHPAYDVIEPMLMVLGVMGAISLATSGFLVTNTIQALLMQQIRQIGIMKAIGARRNQIVGLYLSMVLIFGVLALLIAVPSGAVAARAMCEFIARLANSDIVDSSISLGVVALEMAIGLMVPLLTALYPIVSGVRVTAHKAMNDYGLGSGRFGRGRLDRLLQRVRGLSRPALLSLRNIFRHKGRLAFTLATLILASATFVGVFSVRASLLQTLDEWFDYLDYDAYVSFKRPYRIEHLEREALRVPGVVNAEGWRFSSARRLRPDGSEGDDIWIRAPHADSDLVKPMLVAGRWLLPEDENAIVISTYLLKDEPDIQVGDEIILDMENKELPWVVVGIIKGTPPAPFGFVNYPYYVRIAGGVGRAGVVFVQMEEHPGDPAAHASAQRQLAKDLEEHFEVMGMQVASSQAQATERDQAESQFNVLVAFLLVMAVLLALVGAIGLMGMMSINVLERRREIGVMRALGASDAAVLKTVLIEGIIIGLISWLVGAVLALPFSMALSEAVGQSIVRASLAFSFSLGGTVLWLAVIILLATLASFMPARSASRLTVREVLAYE